MAAPVTLPSIQDPHGAYGQPAYPRSYPPDPRGDPRASNYSASPNSVNGYPPPQPGGHPPQLPPLQPPGDPRSPTYPPPPDARDDYYRSRQPPPPQYGGDPYYQDYHNRQGPPPPGRYPDYPPPGPGGPRYDYPPGAPRYDYGPGGPAMQQAAPRQRTSIACRYCRKRKVGLKKESCRAPLRS
ncbi:C6 transcription factor [Colletotrichum higginsianum]|nr:C6 transcription factor [Colletotrichum higginsianum]